VPFHQHPRFQQVIRENQQFRGVAQQVPGLQQQVKELSDKLATYERKATQGTVSPEERMQRDLAVNALEDLLTSNPQAAERILRSIPAVAKLLDNAEALSTLPNQHQQLQQGQQRAAANAVAGHIANLAKAAGYTVTPQWLQTAYRQVVINAHQIPDGNARFERGDMTVIDEAFKQFEEFIGQSQRGNTQALLETKKRTGQLPPAPRGSAAGPPGLPKTDGKPLNQSMDELATVAANMIRQGGG
jgi:hypothetical protein